MTEWEHSGLHHQGRHDFQFRSGGRSENRNPRLFVPHTSSAREFVLVRGPVCGGFCHLSSCCLVSLCQQESLLIEPIPESECFTGDIFGIASSMSSPGSILDFPSRGYWIESLLE